MTTSIRASYARLALTAAGTNDIRYYLNGILVEPRAEGGAYIVGCDGHRLLAIIDEKATCDAPVILAPDRRTRILLPKVNGKGDTDEAKLELSEFNGKPALLVTGRDGPLHLQIHEAVIDGKYSDWRKVLPNFGELKRGSVDAVQAQYVSAFLSAVNCTRYGKGVEPYQEAPGCTTAYRLLDFPNVIQLVMPLRAGNDSLQWISRWAAARQTAKATAEVAK